MDLMNRKIADRVGYAMRVIGIDSYTLAVRTGLAEPVLSRRLCAADSFKLDELLLVASVLGCDARDLLPAFGYAEQDAGVAA